MMSIDEGTVRALLARIQAREERALEELHRAFARRVHAFVSHRCGDDAIADAVVGDTFYEVWQRPDAFRGESSFSTWLLGVARFKMLSMLRAASRADHEDVDDLADELACGSPAADEQIQRRQDMSLLHRCLERLNAVHRECLHLVYFEEMALAEVARLQGVPEGTVKTRLFHARARMRSCLQPA